jgi:hypothetical protein
MSIRPRLFIYLNSVRPLRLRETWRDQFPDPCLYTIQYIKRKLLLKVKKFKGKKDSYAKL